MQRGQPQPQRGGADAGSKVVDRLASRALLRGASCESQEYKSPNRKLIAILLPTYCEADNIGNLIEEIQKLNLEIVIAVVDDSSPDGTSEVVKKLQRKYGNKSKI